MSPFDLVIFDCDGVLVDSERLAVRIESELLSDLGWPLSETEIVERFVGRSAAYMHQEIERHLGRPIDWDSVFEARYAEVFKAELRLVPGIDDVLEVLDVPACVASSGTHAKLQFTLSLSGLADRFRGRVFSAEDVEHGKPAPDLFLHAANVMRAAPRRCAVVEDSVSGVLAGVSADMTVFGFTGSVTGSKQLEESGAIVFDHMHQLPDLLRSPATRRS